MPLALLLATTHAASFTVDADALRVRARADADAPVVAHLRMGTVVTSDRSDGEWTQVRLPRDPHTHGWVHQDYLTTEARDLAAVREAALAGDDEAVRRWFALDPADAGARELRMSQGNAGASWVAAWEDAPVWIAACVAGGSTVVGSLDPDGRFTPTVATQTGRGARTEAQMRTLAGELAGATWYRDADAGAPLYGSPFPRPGLDPGSEIDPGPGGGPWRLTLGRCQGGTLSTRALTRLTPAAVDLDMLVTAAGRIGQQLPDGATSLGARRIHPDLPLLEVSAQAPTFLETGDAEPYPATQTRLGLAWPDGRIVTSTGGVGLDAQADWSRIEGQPVPTFVGLADFSEPSARGVVLTIIRMLDAGPEVQESLLVFWEGGC
jgi:hypothetical protein